MHILVTGAAGFIGSHTVDLLVQRGHQVTAVDSLDPQVHGEAATPKNIQAHLDGKRIVFVQGDVRDRVLMTELVSKADAVLHLAAAVGVGQSMYLPHHYADVNVGGTSLLLELLVNKERRVKRLVVASSMSLYGEGACQCASCGPVLAAERTDANLAAGRFELFCSRCGAPVQPVGTTEEKPLNCTSIYAITKKVQEEMSVVFGRAYGLPVVALRYFNVYGPRQSLNNPYTGVAAIFLSRLKSGNPPVVFEDGGQSRDFIHVSDIARANVLAVESDRPGQSVFNVGTGRNISVLQVAEILRAGLGASTAIDVTGRYRGGDIRHCHASAARIAEALGFRAEVRVEDGFGELIAWSRGQQVVDRFDRSFEELRARGLVS
jgi:dTDP-L-rhamnose 4-epimerase